HVIFIPNGRLYRFRVGSALRQAEKTAKPVIPGAAGDHWLVRADRRECPPLLGRGAAGQGHGGGLRLTGLVHPADRDLVARVVLDQDLLDVGGRGDRLAGHRGDRVARGQAGAGRRGAGQGAGDGHAAAGAAAVGAAAVALAAEPAEAAAVAEPAEAAAVAEAARVTGATAVALDAEEGGGADVDGG